MSNTAAFLNNNKKEIKIGSLGVCVNKACVCVVWGLVDCVKINA